MAAEGGSSAAGGGGGGGITSIDPTTGKTLAADAIQRILFVASKVHVYQVPPLRSTRGYTAAEWTVRPAIFEARLRVFETEESPASSSSSGVSSIRVTIVLEDPSTGELFAAAPYTHASAVSHCVDSSRFFALRVVGDGGMKAVLGVGFEERPEAFDFGVALQDAGKVLGLGTDKPSTSTSSSAGRRGGASTSTATTSKAAAENVPKKDYSLKEGETIVVNIGSAASNKARRSVASEREDGDALFSIKPPPSSSSSSSSSLKDAAPLLPPPPTADEVKREMRRSGDFTSTSTNNNSSEKTLSAQELGFDDGEFGEFQ